MNLIEATKELNVSKLTLKGCIQKNKPGAEKRYNTIFDVLLTMHLSIFISVFNQLDAQNLFYNKFYFMPLHVSSTCARNM